MLYRHITMSPENAGTLPGWNQQDMTSRSRTRATAGKPNPAATATSLAALAERFANAGTAAEIAYAVLREAILSNILTPGTRLRADDLAKELGVSKTPVREALRKLQAEDFVVVGAGNALTVKVLSEKQLLEIYYTREALEGMAARLAAENAGQLDLTQLRAVLHDVEVALAKRDRSGIRNYTGEFQLAVFKAAHNDFLYDLAQVFAGKDPQSSHHDDQTCPAATKRWSASVATCCAPSKRATRTRPSGLHAPIAVALWNFVSR